MLKIKENVNLKELEKFDFKLLKGKYPDLKTDEDFNLLTELVILISNFFGDDKND